MSRGGWNSSTPAGETYKPYDPISDPYCPHTKTHKFVKHMDGYLAKAKAERKAQLRKQSKVGVTVPKSRRRKKKPSRGRAAAARAAAHRDDVDDLPNSPSQYRPQSLEDTINMGIASVPAVSFQETSDADPTLELEVLKCILLREGYVGRLQGEAEKGRALVSSKAAAAKFVDLLDLVRQITVETCEAIQRWRYTSKRPFMWNGVNYLLKMATDLDFLSNVRPVISWLGFSMQRNPFIVPMSLDFRVPTPGPKALQRSWEAARDNFHNIGGANVPAAIAEEDVSGGRSASPQKVPAEMKSTARAYAEVGPADARTSPQRSHAQEDKRVEILRMMPSQVGDVDMLRIREAEKLILHEERTHGRFVRDDNGKLVPEVIWQQMQALREQQEMMAKRGGRPGLHTPLGSSSSINSNSSAPPARAHPNDRVAGSRSAVSPARGASGAHNDGGRHVLEPSQNTGPLRGRKQTLKDGGQLVPLSTAGTDGGQRRPKARSHLAQLDNDIKRQHRDNDRLMKKLERVRQELEKEEAAIRGIEEEVIESNGRAPADLKLRKIRFEEKFAEYERQERELARRTEETADAEMRRKVLKEKRRVEADRSRRAVIERKRLQGLGAGGLEALDDDVEMPDDEKAAIQIQRVVRGKLGKVHVGVRRRVYNDAALQLQRVQRGKRARDRIAQLKAQEAAVVVIQRRSRGFIDRRKVAQKRQAKLVNVSARLLQASWRRHTGADRMRKRREFVAAKKSILRSAQQLYPSYIAQLKDVEDPAPLLLLRTLQCVMILLDRSVKPDASEGVTWSTLIDFVDSEQFLPAVRRLAHDAFRETLSLPRALVAQVEVFFHDPNFSVPEVSKIRPGGKACALLLEWVHSALTVNTLTPLFADTLDLATSVYWDNAAEIQELERKAREKVPKTYIVDGVLPEQPSRPRPVIVCMARDVPFDRKEKLVAQLQDLLPDVFVRVNKPIVDMKALQDTLDVGKSIILDIDMGNSQQHRRRFVAQADVIRKTLIPTPLLVAVEGDRANRHGGGAAIKYGVGRDDSMNMQDWDLKRRLEDAAEQLFLLNLDTSIAELEELGQKVVNAPPELVLLFEAAMITLTPQHRFQTPSETSPLVTWPAARKMLTDASTFVRRLAMVDSDAIPLQNLLVLQAYRKHPHWPTEATIPGGTRSPPCYLMKLIDNVVEYATELDRAGGPPAVIVTKQGTFGAVLKIGDAVDLRQQFVQLITPALRDMKIYAQAHRIQRQHLVVSVFRDCRKFIFIAYDPKSGLQYYTAVPEDMADVLLAPNSIESAQDARPPPETLTELCARLTELLQLELEPLAKGEKKKKSERRKELWLRRKLVRLCRASQKIGPVLCTITASEARRKEVLLEVYVPKTSTTYKLTATEKDFKKIEADALEEAGAELEAMRSRDPFKMAKYVIDRLEFRRGQLRIRLTGGGGRRLLEAGIVLNGVRVVASIFYSDTAGVRLQVYVPTASETSRFYLSQREMKDLLGDCSLSGKMVWQQLLLKRLSVQNKSRVLFDRCLYKESVNVGGIFMTVECCALGPDGGIMLVAYRNDTSQVWRLSVSDDELNDVIVTDAERRQGVKVWPAKVEDTLKYNQICSRMPAALSWDIGAADDGSARDPGIVLQFGEGIAVGTADDSKAQVEDPEKSAQFSSADVLAAAVVDDSVTTTAGRPETAVGPSSEETKVTKRKAETEKYRRGRLLCSFAYKYESKAGATSTKEHSALNGRIFTCSGYDDDNLDGELRLVVYDSQNATGAACALASFEVQRAVGQRLELLIPERRFELAEYLLRERLIVVPAESEEAKRDPAVGKYSTDGVFAIRVQLARVYSQTRITPLPIMGTADRDAQMKPSTVIAGGVQRRGRKVLTSGTRLDNHRVVVTGFAVEHPPQLRFSAYLPEMSLKFSVSDASESVAAEVSANLNDDAQMKALAQERAQQLALKFAGDGRPVGVELLPRDEVKAREALAELERQRVAAGGTPKHGGRAIRGEATQLLREGVRLQGLKLVMSVWADIVKAKKTFGQERKSSSASSGQEHAGASFDAKDVRQIWVVVEDPSSGHAADCDVPVEAVLAQTGGTVDPAKVLRIRRLLVAKMQPTAAAAEAARDADRKQVSATTDADAQYDENVDTELSVRYCASQLLKRVPFVLGHRSSPPCLLRLSARAEVLHAEFCGIGSNPGASLVLTPSDGQPTIALLSASERVQLASLMMTAFKEASSLGKFEVASVIHAPSTDDSSTVQEIAAVKGRLQGQFDAIYKAVIEPLLENADNTILFSAFERLLQDLAGEQASNEARTTAAAEGKSAAEIEMAAATAASAAVVKLHVERSTEINMTDLSKLLDALDWAGFYAADCFKFFDREFDGVVSFDEFCRWQEFEWTNRKNRRGPGKRALLETYRQEHLSAAEEEAALAAARRDDVLSDDDEDDAEEGSTRAGAATDASAEELAVAQDVARSYLDSLYSQLDGSATSTPPPKGASPQKPDVSEDILRKTFNSIDKNGGGSLDRSEMEEFIAKLGWSEAVSVDDAFLFLDKNLDEEAGQAQISFEEFLRWREFAWERKAVDSGRLARSTSRRSFEKFHSDLELVGEGEEGEEEGDTRVDEGVAENEAETSELGADGATEFDTDDDADDGPGDGPVALPASGTGDEVVDDVATESEADKYSLVAVDADKSLNALDSDMNAIMYLNELYSEVTLPADDGNNVDAVTEATAQQ